MKDCPRSKEGLGLGLGLDRKGGTVKDCLRSRKGRKVGRSQSIERWQVSSIHFTSLQCC